MMAGKPVVWILPRVKAMLDLYIDSVSYEISGLGSVTRVGRRDFLIDKIYLFKQNSGEIESTLNKLDVGTFVLDYIEAGGEPTKLRFWWHSHGDMDVFWSKKDEETIEGLGIPPVDWWLSLVGNRRGETKVRIDVYQPISLTVDNLPLRIYYSPHGYLRDQVEAEVKEKVTYVPPQEVVYGPWSGSWPFAKALPHKGGSDGQNKD